MGQGAVPGGGPVPTRCNLVADGTATHDDRRWAWLVPVVFALVQSLLQLLHRHPLAGTVENDFPAHILHAASWRAVFTVDGFYPFGYALILRVGTLLLSDPFVAAKIIAIIAAALSLRVVHAIAREAVDARTALLVQLLLALNWNFHETALLVGTDQCASLAALLAVRALAAALRRPARARDLAAGALAGVALLVRYTSLVLLPAFAVGKGWALMRGAGGRRALTGAALVLAVATAVYSPQMVLSWRQQGTPFYQTLARNVWFGMHGGWDWRQWPRDQELSVLDLARQEPRLFLQHWGKESLVGLARYGAMTVDALPPRLARKAAGGWPAACNLLTGLALLATVASVRPARMRCLWRRLPSASPTAVFFGLVVVGWAVAVGMAFSAARFLLTPWILCAVGAVALFRAVCVPADNRHDWRSALALAAWLAAYTINTSCAVWLTLRQG